MSKYLIHTVVTGEPEIKLIVPKCCCWHFGLEFLHFIFSLLSKSNGLLHFLANKSDIGTNVGYKMGFDWVEERRDGGTGGGGGWTGFGDWFKRIIINVRDSNGSIKSQKDPCYNGPFDWSVAAAAACHNSQCLRLINSRLWWHRRRKVFLYNSLSLRQLWFPKLSNRTNTSQMQCSIIFAFFANCCAI